MSKDHKVMYKILKTLQVWRGRENFDIELISAKKMKMEYEDWEQLMIEMAEAGYIKGVVYSQSLTDQFPHIAQPIHPRITMAGVDFVEEDPRMKKAGESLRLAGEIFSALIVG